VVAGGVFLRKPRGAEARREENGEGGESSGVWGLSNLKPRRGEGRTWERGLRPGQFPTERDEANGGLGEGMNLTGGPHPSAC